MSVTPPIDPQQLQINQIFAAFGKPSGGSLPYEPAFGPGFQDTQDGVNSWLSSHTRANSPPVDIQSWECRIGLAKFFVPPININVNRTFQSGAISQGAIRQISTPKFNSGHSETLISMSIYFPSDDQIWGYKGSNINIDFQNAPDSDIDRFASSLRGLIAQFRYMPFLPVSNAYLNGVWNITSVAMKGLTLSTLPGFPFVIVAQLEMLALNSKIYIPMVDTLAEAIHWGRYREYLGRCAVQMQKQLDLNFLTVNDPAKFNPTVQNLNKVLTQHGEQVGSNNYNINDFLDDPNQSVLIDNKQDDFQDGSNIAFYFPDHDPAQFVVPQNFAFDPAHDPSINNKSWWDQITSSIGLAQGSIGGFLQVQGYASSISSGGLKSELQLLKTYLNELGIAAQSMDSNQFNKYKAFSLSKKNINSSSSPSAVHVAESEIIGAWYGTVYNTIISNPTLQKLFALQDVLRGTVIIKEWEIPMRKLNINSNNVIVQNVSVSLGNNLAPMRLAMMDEPAYQHIGGLDTHITIDMVIQGEKDLTAIRNMYDLINGLARLEHAHAVLGFLGIKNLLTTLVATKYVIPSSFTVNTVPNYPHVYEVQIVFLDFDVFQQKRELLSSEQEQEFIVAFSKRNPFLRLKQLWGAISSYPDFPLAVKDDNGRIVGHLDPDYYFNSYDSVDTDIVEGFNTPIDPNKTNRLNSDYQIVHHLGPLSSDGSMQSIGLHGGGFDLRSGDTLIAGDNTHNEAHLGNTTLTPFVNDGTVQATPPVAFQHPHVTSDGLPTALGDPSQNFAWMMRDTQYRDMGGRMIRAFPSYMLWLIDEGGMFAGVKLFDNFYGLQSVMNFSVQSSEDSMGDTLVLEVSNLYSRLSTAYKDLVDPSLFPDLAPLINSLLNTTRNVASGTDPSFLVNIDTFNLTPGVRLHLRCGYGGNPNRLETIFNGVVTQVKQGDVMEITAQSDAIEFSQIINNSNPNGNSGNIDGSILGGFYLSEPRDLIVRLMSMGSSTFKEMISYASRGVIFSENKYGIRHFGSILYEPMTQRETDVNNTVKKIFDSHSSEWNASVNPISGGTAPLTDVVTGAPAGIISGPIASLVTQMWINLNAKRDYEIFRRNVYAGNGTGISQYQGGDIDGGTALSLGLPPPGGVDTNGNAFTTGADPLAVLGAADAAAQNKPSSSGTDSFSGNPVFTHSIKRILGLDREVGDDVPGGTVKLGPFSIKVGAMFGPFAEVSFRAQTYMKTIWDIFQVCASLLPNYICAVRPFEGRSTLFYGKPHWLYTSGVIPLSTGLSDQLGPQIELPDLTIDKIVQDIEQAQQTRTENNQVNIYDTLNQITSTIADASSGVVGGDPNASAAGVGSSTTPLSGTNNTQIAYNYFVAKGLTNFQAAGIVGNFLQESGLNPAIQEHGKGVSGILPVNGVGFGIAQWTFTARQAPLVAFAKAAGQPIDTLGVQLDFAWQELNTTHKGALDALRATTNVVDATEIFLKLFEGDPGTTAITNRTSNAEKVLNQYGTTSAAGGLSGLIQSVTSTLVTALPTTVPTVVLSDLQLAAKPVYQSTRTDDQAKEIWKEFNASFATNSKTQDIFRSHYPQKMNLFNQIALDFVNWMDSNAYNLGWLALTADVVVDNNPISQVAGEAAKILDPGGIVSGVQHFLDKAVSTVTGQTTDQYDFAQARLLFEVYITQGVGQPPGSTTATSSPQGAIQWMLNHASAGFSHGSILGRTVEELKKNVWDKLFSIFDDVKKAFGVVLTGVVNLIRTSMALLNNGLNMSAFSGKQSNLLNAVFNDSHYYDPALVPGSILWQADNCLAGDTKVITWDGIKPIRELSGTNQKLLTSKGWREAPIKSFGQQKLWKIDLSRGGVEKTIYATAEHGWFVDNTSKKTSRTVLTKDLIKGHRLSSCKFPRSGGYPDISWVVHSIKETDTIEEVFCAQVEEIHNFVLDGNILTSNCFTREFGEPVVEIRQPFQRVHYINSFQHILSNGIIENISDVATVITAMSNGKNPKTVYFDKGAPPDRQVEKQVETGLFWDKPNWYSLALHPSTTIRDFIKHWNNSDDATEASRVARWHLKKNLQNIYGGEIFIMGDPSIRPYDLVYISDIYEKISGMFEVGQVIHHFTPDLGLVTSITPNAIVTINDPAKWEFGSLMMRHWAVQSLRNNMRRQLSVRQSQATQQAIPNNISAQQLAAQLQTEIQGSTQYTGGLSALVKDIAGAHGIGAVATTVGLEATILAGPFLAWKAFSWVRDNILDQHGCFPAGAEVLTEVGYKSINNIVVGDMVFTHKNRYSPVISTMVRNIDESIYKLSLNRMTGITLTPTKEHPFLVFREKQVKLYQSYRSQEEINNCKPEWIEARDLNIGDYLVIQGATESIGMIPTFDLKDYLNCPERHLITDEFIQAKNSSTKKIKRVLTINPNIMYMIGRYLGDGHIEYERNIPRLIGFTYNKKEKSAIEKLCKIFQDEFNLNCNQVIQSDENGTYNLEFGSTTIATWLDSEFFHGFANKIIPEWVFNLPKEYKVQLLTGLFSADGCDTIRESSGIQFKLDVTNKQLASSAFRLLRDLGAYPTFNGGVVQKTNKGEGSGPHFIVVAYSPDSEEFTKAMGYEPSCIRKVNRGFIRTNEYVAYRISNIEKIPFKGEVFNFSVENDESYVVEGIISHNCYIQYLTRNGRPMDAGLSYNQGVAVGQMHVWSGLSQALGIRIQVPNLDGTGPYINTSDLLAQLGWNPNDTSALGQHIDIWNAETQSRVLQQSNKNPEAPPLIPPAVQMASITGIIDSQTLSIGTFGQGPLSHFKRVRLGHIVIPTTISPGAAGSVLAQLQPETTGAKAIAFIKQTLDDLTAAGYTLTVALRADPTNLTVDKDPGLLLASLFITVPDGTGADVRDNLLLAYANNYPQVAWTDYITQGIPYTLNWALVIEGLATVDITALALKGG